MQRHSGNADTLLLHLFKQLRRKMQAGRRRGGGAPVLGIDRLIAFVFAQRLMNVGRQGHLPDFVEHLEEIALTLEADQAQAALQRIEHLARQALPKGEHRAGPRLFPGVHHGLPQAKPALAQQQKFHFGRPALPASEQARRDDARIVEHQQVPR